ncbi:hypothetical protein ACJMK2_043746 [Sinanodonta woodiana]|uniref:Uncharacterized protein n=1 Tax=Sinanodonta woodiana TaxID=1069815 RepID=A0ABD3VXW2_SINWO
MNGEEELVPIDTNPALRRFRTRATDDNRLSLAAINVDQDSWNNSKLEDPTSNLHFFGCSRTRRQRNLKTGYRLGRAHEKTMSSDSDEEMNDLELLDSDDEGTEPHSEPVDAESVEVQTGSVNFGTLSLEENTSVKMNDNDNLSQNCKISEPQYSEKYVDESKIQTELPSSGQLNNSEGSVLTNSLLNSDDQKMCADMPNIYPPSNDDRLESTLAQMCADMPNMDPPSNDDRLESTLAQMCAGVPNMDPPSNDDRLESTLAQMCAGVPNIDQRSIADTLDSNPKQLELDYLRKLRRKKTIIEDDNRLALYDCCVKKDKVFFQSDQNEQMNSESQETRVSSTSEPQMKNTSQENSRTAMENKTSKDLDTVWYFETRPELDQEHMAFLAKLRKIKTKFTDDNRLTLFFENDTVVQVLPNRDTSGRVPGLGRNSLVSKGQRSSVADSVLNQPTSVDSKSKRSTRSENKKTTMATKGKSSGKANHQGPVRSFKSDLQRPLQSKSAMGDRKSKRGVGNQDTKRAERKTPQISLTSGPSPNVHSAQNSSQGSAGQGKMSDLDSYEWYFKGINRAESERILRDEGTNGCFMVRDSSMPGMYSISLIYKPRRRGQVKHYLISKSMDDKFYLEKNQEFTTIPELVDYHKIHVGCLMTLLGNPPVRRNGDMVRTSTGFVSDSDDTSSIESLPSTDESQGDSILMGQDDKSLGPEDGEFYLDDSVWANVIETEGERCLTLNPLPIGKGRNTVLCIDISASMSGTAWDQLKTALDDFIEGLEENAKENGPEENIAIITFGHQTRVALTLTNDYIQVKNTLDQLYPDGVSPLSAGMALVVVPLACIHVTRPMHVDLHGIHVYPRAVIFTDGKATPVGMISGNDECPEKNRDEIHAKLIQQFEKMWTEIKVEFIFVPMGDANRTILGTLAEGQNGKMEEYTNMKRLTRLSRNMGLACQIGGHMLAGMKSSDKLDSYFFQSLVAAISPELTSQEIYDMLEIVEMFHTQKNEEPESFGISLSEEQDTFEELRRDKLPSLGTRVRRGRNWKGGNYDSSGPGTITGHSKKDDNSVYVQWDNGFKYSYIFGSEIEVVNEPKPSTLGKLSVCVGCMVRRGPHWQWGNADGEPGALGTVYRVEHNNTVQVRWLKTGNKGNYRCGHDGLFDVIVCNPEDPYESKITEEVLNKRNREKEIEASTHLKVSTIGKRLQSAKRTDTGTKDEKSISWYKEPIIHISHSTERNSDLEGTQEALFKMNETSSGDPILTVIGAQSSFKSEKLNPCEQNNENRDWELNELQDISLEKEKTLTGGVVNESKLAEMSVLPEDELGESNSMEEFENAAFFNNLEVNINPLETVQEPLMEIISEQNNENTSWELNELQDVSLEKEKTLTGGVVNESKLAEPSVLPEDELGESNSMEEFENAAFFNNLEVNINPLETVQDPLMERNEASSGDPVLSVIGAKSSTECQKQNPCEQNNENTSWELNELQDVSLEKEKTLNDGVVNESKLAETSVLPEDELGESNSMEKFENAAFFNNLEVNINPLETVQEPLMERISEQNNENTSWELNELQDVSLEKEKTLTGGVVNESKLAETSVLPEDELGESNSMEKFENAAFFNNLEVNINPLETVQEPFMERISEQNNGNTSWKVKELQDVSLEREKTLNDGVVNESKLAEKYVLPNAHDQELEESNSLEEFEHGAFFNNLEMNIDALETVQDPFIESDEASSGESDSLEKFEKSKFSNNLEGDIIELGRGKDQNRHQINDESDSTEDKTTNKENYDSDSTIISEQSYSTDESQSTSSSSADENENLNYGNLNMQETSPSLQTSSQLDSIQKWKMNAYLEANQEQTGLHKSNEDGLFSSNLSMLSPIISEQSYSTDESQSSKSSFSADDNENLNYGDLNMQETSPTSQTSSQLDSIQKWKMNAYLEANQEQIGLHKSNEYGFSSSNLPMSSRTMSQESLFTQDSSYDWRGSMSELSDTSLCLGEGEVMPQWVWLNQDNMWEPFSRDMNMKLEKSFRRNPKSTTVVQIGIQL